MKHLRKYNESAQEFTFIDIVNILQDIIDEYGSKYVDGEPVGMDRYVVKNDNGLSRSFSKTRFELCFIPLSEIRQDKLKELGI